MIKAILKATPSNETLYIKDKKISYSKRREWIQKMEDNMEAAAREFEQQHLHPEVNKGAIGGHINYIFTPTSIGNGKSIHCSICGEEENITDYDCW